MKSVLGLCIVLFSTSAFAEVVDIPLYQNKFEFGSDVSKFRVASMLLRTKDSQILLTEIPGCVEEFPGECKTRKVLKRDQVLEVSVVYNNPNSDDTETLVNFPAASFPADVVSEMKELSKSCIFCNHSKLSRRRSELAKQWISLLEGTVTKTFREPIYQCDECTTIIGWGKPYDVLYKTIELSVNQ